MDDRWPDDAQLLLQTAAGERLAWLADGRLEDVFWTSFVVTPLDEEAAAALSEPEAWESATVVGRDGAPPNPHTFASATTVRDWVDGRTNRVWFRSLGPRDVNTPSRWLRWLWR